MSMEDNSSEISCSIANLSCNSLNSHISTNEIDLVDSSAVRPTSELLDLIPLKLNLKMRISAVVSSDYSLESTNVFAKIYLQRNGSAGLLLLRQFKITNNSGVSVDLVAISSDPMEISFLFNAGLPFSQQDCQADVKAKDSIVVIIFASELLATSPRFPAGGLRETSFSRGEILTQTSWSLETILSDMPKNDCTSASCQLCSAISAPNFVSCHASMELKSNEDSNPCIAANIDACLIQLSLAQFKKELTELGINLESKSKVVSIAPSNGQKKHRKFDKVAQANLARRRKSQAIDAKNALSMKRLLAAGPMKSMLNQVHEEVSNKTLANDKKLRLKEDADITTNLIDRKSDLLKKIGEMKTIIHKLEIKRNWTTDRITCLNKAMAKSQDCVCSQPIEVSDSCLSNAIPDNIEPGLSSKISEIRMMKVAERVSKKECYALGKEISNLTTEKQRILSHIQSTWQNTMDQAKLILKNARK